MACPPPTDDIRDRNHSQTSCTSAGAASRFRKFGAIRSLARVAGIAVVSFLTALTAFFTVASTSTALAQEPGNFVDLSVAIEGAGIYDMTITNHGNVDAYGVEVSLDIEGGVLVNKILNSRHEEFSIENYDVDLITGIWTVGTLAAGQSHRMQFGSELPDGATEAATIPLMATISNEAPKEHDALLYDNTVTVWRWVPPSGSSKEAFFNSYFEVNVDKRFPAHGEDVTFTLHFVTTPGGGDAETQLYGLEIDVELEGLKLVGSTPASDTVFTGVANDRSGRWQLGSQKGGDLVVVATLDGKRPLEERCFTATFGASTPPFSSQKFTNEPRSSTTCLGEDPTVVISSGEVGLMTVYPCIGVTTYPCDREGALEVVAVFPDGRLIPGVHRADFSTIGQHASAILRPQNVIVHVRDNAFPQSRVYESNTITDANTVTWVTSNAGVTTSLDNSRMTSADWTHYLWRLSSVQLPDGAHVAIGPDSRRDRNYVNTKDRPQHPTGGLSTMSSSVRAAINTYVRFTNLGTYVFDFAQDMTHSTSGNVGASSTYTFHVGPIAELAVSDGAADMAPSGTRAFTIVAVNNGPDDAPAAQVTVSGLNAGDYVSHSATAGSFDSTAGVWTIGELRESGYYQDTYGRNGEVLTIVTNANAGAEITAEIENTRDYRVCIDSSGEDVNAASESACTSTSGNTWHTTEYYDYLDDNNSATITAKSGTGADLPSLRSTEAVTAIKISWSPVDDVNGQKVDHYEVQRRTNPWETIAKVIETNYVDGDVALGQTYQYRVRGVNQRGQTGPWSSSSGRIEAEVAARLATGPVRILRIEPSISEVSLRGGDLVRLAVEVYGRQDLRDDSLGDRSDVTFDWTLEEFGMQPGGNVGRLMGAGSSGEDGSRISALDDRRVLYIAPDSPGRFRIKVSLDPGTECFPRREFETNEDVEERCSAIFEVTALRSAHVDTATLDPRNPEGPIPLVLADSHGQQYEVFTPVDGGTFVGDTASLTAKAGAVPDDELIGLRISEIGPATNEGGTHQRYTLGGDLYAVAAVDASGERVEAYELNSAVEVCVPLPPELRSNLSDLALVATNPDDSLTILATRVRISTSGTNVCGQLSTVPAQVAVGTSGALSPLPTAFPGASGQTGTPDTGGWTPSSLAMAVWIALLGLTVLVVVFGLLLQRRRKTDWSL